jgi:hypothetical protein
MLWSPFDVFNRVSIFEPQEEKSGVTAIRVTVPTGITGSIEGVFSPETTAEESRAGLRILWNRFGSEFTVNTIHNVVNTYAQNITGAGIKTDLIIGLWAEGAHFSEKPLPGNTGINSDYFRFNAGIDYSFDFGKRLFVSMEYMHDESGESDKSKYDYISALTKGRSLLGSDYIYGMGQLTLSEFTTLSAGVMANMNDGGVLLMPGLSHSLFPNTELRLGVYVAAAKEGTEFNPSAVMDPLNYAGNTVLYCWFKLFL